MKYDERNYVEYAMPIEYGRQHIFSAKVVEPGNVFEGVFDNLSYGLICLSILAIALATSALNGINLFQALFMTVKVLLRQDLDPKLERKNQGFVLVWVLMLGFISTMYYSIVISLLAVKNAGHNINHITDLLELKQFSSKRIYIHERNRVISDSPYAEALKHRIDTFNHRERLVDAVKSVFLQTHVLITWPNNFGVFYDAFLSDSFKCLHPMESSYTSEPLTFDMIGYRYSPNFQWKEKLTQVK